MYESQNSFSDNQCSSRRGFYYMVSVISLGLKKVLNLPKSKAEKKTLITPKSKVKYVIEQLISRCKNERSPHAKTEQQQLHLITTKHTQKNPSAMAPKPQANQANLSGSVVQYKARCGQAMLTLIICLASICGSDFAPGPRSATPHPGPTIKPTFGPCQSVSQPVINSKKIPDNNQSFLCPPCNLACNGELCTYFPSRNCSVPRKKRV